jgi:hypothetical protein
MMPDPAMQAEIGRATNLNAVSGKGRADGPARAGAGLAGHTQAPAYAPRWLQQQPGSSCRIDGIAFRCLPHA